MKRVACICCLLAGCGVLRPEPQVQVRVDTVTVTQQVEPPLPEGRAVQLCLSTGVTVPVLIAGNGDTLIGEKRARLKDLRPAVGFAGVYAQDKDFYLRGDAVTYDRRNYRRAGVERERECDELKLVGTHQGVPLFAEVTAREPLPVIIIPVRPGLFQDYLRAR